MYTIYSRFVESSQIGLHKKEVGRVRNHDAFYRINNLILKAQQMPDGRVKLLGRGAATVPSLSKPESSYTVTGADSTSGQPSCTCPAAQKDGQCWHIIKVLMLSGASAKSLMQCLGLFKGSSLGGYPVLYAQMAAATHAAILAANDAAPQQPELACSESTDLATIPSMAATASVQPPAVESNDATMGAQPEQLGSQIQSAGLSSQRRRTQCDKALAAVNRLKCLGKDWEPDSADWELLEFHALMAVHRVEKALATGHMLAPVSLTACMLPNPDAPLHNSLQRGKSWMEVMGRQSKKRKSESSPDARPEAFGLLPAARRKGKEVSVLEEIKKRVGSHGVGGGAAVAAVSSGAAKEPSCEGSGFSVLGAVDPLGPSAAMPAIPTGRKAEHAEVVQPAHASGRSKRATQGLPPSRFRI